MILLLSGTGEGRQLGLRLRAAGLPFVASVTTPEGRALFAGVQPPPEVIVTRFSDESLAAFLRQRHIRAILDATHPFAQRISATAMRVAAQAHLPYIRYERPAGALAGAAGQIQVVPDVAAAAQACLEHGRRIFLTTGANTLAAFREVMARKWVMARILPTVASLTQALQAGLSPAQIVALRGPFSQALERALLQEYGIDLLVTKESGAAGGLDAKLAAAAELGVPAVVISRPTLPYPNRYHDLEQAVQAVVDVVGLHQRREAPQAAGQPPSASATPPSSAMTR
jgi:precorrin-6A/cobalt-precorrin-6A reductase